MILGCHPGAKAGLPVELDWLHTSADTVSIEIYEYLRRKERRRSKPLRMSNDYRREYLSSLGLYSSEDFMNVLVNCLDIQESRIRSAGQENRILFHSDRFFETSPAALRVGNTFKSVLKSTKVLGDTSVLAGRKGSQAAVTAAVTASKATGSAVGASSKVIVKVSSEGVKAIVKVVSSSAERVRSRSVGRRRTTSSGDGNPTEDEKDAERARMSRTNRRPSLGRLRSSQECKDVGELNRSDSRRSRSRSRSQLRRHLSGSDDESREVKGRRRSLDLRRSLSYDDACDNRSRLEDERLQKLSLTVSRLLTVNRGCSSKGYGTDDESSEEISAEEQLAIAASKQ
jgi:hypothetical protein